MPKIFISYRRDDAGGFAGRLGDALSSRYGAGNVFRDVDDIVAGSRFVAVLDQALAASDVFLPLIGRAWLDPGPAGVPRLLDRDDYVRREIATALARNIRIIPVLLDGARMPGAHELPHELEPLIYLQAITLDDRSWAADVESLGQAIDAASSAASPVPGLPGALRPGTRRRLALLVGFAALVLAGYGVWQRMTPPEVSGEWKLDDGSRWWIRQDGSALRIEDVHYASREVWRAGSGRVTGNTVDVDLQYRFQKGISLRGSMALSAGGHVLEGDLTEAPSGRTVRITLRR